MTCDDQGDMIDMFSIMTIMIKLAVDEVSSRDLYFYIITWFISSYYQAVGNSAENGLLSSNRKNELNN